VNKKTLLKHNWLPCPEGWQQPFASRISRLQSQFVGRERHASSLTSFQKAAARTLEQQDWSDLVNSKRRAQRLLLIIAAHCDSDANRRLLSRRED
jgi:hypothetical protein